jgi:hypothetical protein
MNLKLTKIFILIIFLLFLSNNLYAKIIYEPNINIKFDMQNIILSSLVELSDDELSIINGEQAVWPCDPGKPPKVYLLNPGEASGNNKFGFAFMIVWPDGTVDYQKFNPYNGSTMLGNITTSDPSKPN